jgi:hypothetical protein
MLGEQDPNSPHGFNIYYTGLSAGAFKQQPSFMGPDPNVYSTDYDNFSCDHGTGMETQSKFADSIYSHDRAGLFVNLFIPSEATWEDQGAWSGSTLGSPTSRRRGSRWWAVTPGWLSAFGSRRGPRARRHA